MLEEKLKEYYKMKKINLVDAAIKHLNKNVPYIFEQTTSEQIHTQLSSSDPEVRRNVFSDYDDEDITPDHLHKALDDSDWRIRYSAASHENASPENLHKALDDSDLAVRDAAINNKNSDESHVEKALKDENYSSVRLAAVKHIKANNEQLNNALKDHDQEVRHAAVDALYNRS